MKQKLSTPSEKSHQLTVRRKKPKQHPKQLYEYILLITPRFNERKKQMVTLVALRTVKEFSNFRYVLVAEARVDDRTLQIDIKGLRAPELTLPNVGPAIFETEFDILDGTYEIVIRKLRKEVNIFRVSISTEQVIVEQSPKMRFIDLVTHMEDW